MIIKSSAPKLKTLQEIFNFVCRHLLDQKRKCTHGWGDCALHLNDSACSLGCLIPKDSYFSGLESMTDDPLDLPLHIDYEVENAKKLLIDLRTCHDHSRPEDWSARLKIIANEYWLDMPL